MKICNQCKIPKALSEFYKKISSKSKASNSCKKCELAYKRIHYSNNKEEIRKRQKEYRDSNQKELRLKRKQERIQNPTKSMFNAARARAKKNGQEFSITKEDIVIPVICPILGFILNTSGGKRTDYSASLDRKDSSIGYIPGNINVISYRANRIKNDSTLSELRAIVDWLESLN